MYTHTHTDIYNVISTHTDLSEASAHGAIRDSQTVTLETQIDTHTHTHTHMDR